MATRKARSQSHTHSKAHECIYCKEGFKYNAQTKALAEHTGTLSVLLWQKAIAHSSPEVRAMLFAYAQTCRIRGDVLPTRRWPIRYWEREQMSEYIREAEALLTGNFADIHERHIRAANAKL